MKIEKCVNYGTRNNSKLEEYIRVSSGIYFDDANEFYDKLYMCLLAGKDKPMYSWEKYEIGLGIRDIDDSFYCEGYIYKPTKEQFSAVLHELINWMRDVESGTIYCWKYIKEEFFPKLNCERKDW